MGFSSLVAAVILAANRTPVTRGEEISFVKFSGSERQSLKLNEEVACLDNLVNRSTRMRRRKVRVVLRTLVSALCWPAFLHVLPPALTTSCQRNTRSRTAACSGYGLTSIIR
jgi:hypothetical protein